MSIMIQIRNVPDETHRTLKSRAALAGQSLSDFLLAEITAIADRPSLDELAARLRTRTPVDPSIDVTAIIREARDRT